MFKCSADKRRVSPAQSFPRFFLLLLFFSFPSPLMLWILCDKSKGSRCTTTVHRHQPLCDSISVMSGSRSNAVKEKKVSFSAYLLYPYYVLVSLSPSVCGCQLFSVLIDRPPIISPFRKPLESINNNWINQQANETKNKKNKKTENWLQRERETSRFTRESRKSNHLIIYLFALYFLNIKWYTTRTRWTSDGSNPHDLSLRKPHQKWKKKKKIDIKKVKKKIQLK